MLEYINDPNDIKQIQPEDYKLLAKDIRRFLLRNVSRTGGHLASNLGIVELTMALHLVLDFPKGTYGATSLIGFSIVLLKSL